MKIVKWFCSAIFSLLFIALVLTSTCYAQVPHITQPFFFLWDYPTVSLADHFELQIDTNIPVAISGVPSVPAATPGDSTFKLAADPALPVGTHTFNIYACPTATIFRISAVGCVGSIPGPFAFVLDAPAPLPLPSGRRLGVGI